ncbi:MAG: NADH-quinone oxidoreductase subunit E [Halieaceae bacterium]|jgi:NADH-quinone oxidoreductase subunit E
MTELIRALSSTELEEIDRELAHAPYRSAVAIDALKIVQAHRGWVSDESLREIANYLEMSSAELDSIATFYNLIFRQPVGDNVILFCNSVSCWIRGCTKIEAHLSARLGIGRGQTTGDNKYTLLPVPCLGACDKAPVMMVGDELHEDLTVEKIDNIIGGGES